MKATAHHPFYNETAGVWANAADLGTGTLLATPGNGRASITAIRHYKAEGRTYNLTVESVHTYYVVAGQTPVLVHNSDGSCGVLQAEFDTLPKGKQGHVREMPDGQTMRDAFERWTAGAE
ncbi:Hint domain-containing protein [Saccharothrix sp. NRRL B-16348]|uniref:Hint domain-containing protein n=1 Tax=Saccharothrix sp. NRRL B-16348 TaxID=1415542 RepID=UPI0009E7AF8C